MVSNQKPVIVRRFSRDWLPGYANLRNLGHDGVLEILDTGGKVVTLPLSEIKHVSFVRDFGPAGQSDPERLLRKTFASRPRTAGVTVRVRFKDNDVLEGLAANDLSLLEHDGILLTPPDTRSNTQRIYIPKLAIAELEILSIIKPPASRKSSSSLLQDDLFANTPIPSGRPN
jgi:hypothetical protein